MVSICALFSLGGLLLGACQGDYPLEPTNCDRWCEATKEKQCGYYSPAGCVVGCEETHITRAECSNQFNAALACYEQSEIPCDEDDPYFYYPGPYPCEQEEIALGACTAQFGDWGLPF